MSQRRVLILSIACTTQRTQLRANRNRITRSLVLHAMPKPAAQMPALIQERFMQILISPFVRAAVVVLAALPAAGKPSAAQGAHIRAGTRRRCMRAAASLSPGQAPRCAREGGNRRLAGRERRRQVRKRRGPERVRHGAAAR